MRRVAKSKAPRIRLSISRLAEAFELDRRTVAKRLALAKVRPAGLGNGSPVYELRDAWLPLTRSQAVAKVTDPRALPPAQRRAWYQSENERRRLEADGKQLIPAAEVEAEMAKLVNRMVPFLDTLGDQLERDAGLTPEQVTLVQEGAAAVRREIVGRSRRAGPQWRTAPAGHSIPRIRAS